MCDVIVLGTMGNTKMMALLLPSHCSQWFWYLTHLYIMQDRKMLWEMYKRCWRKESFFQQRIKNVTYTWSLSLCKFSHIEKIEILIRDQWAKVRVEVYFIWMKVNNLVWLKRPFAPFSWGPEEACQQRACPSCVFCHHCGGEEGDPGTSPAPTPYIIWLTQPWYFESTWTHFIMPFFSPVFGSHPKNL